MGTRLKRSPDDTENEGVSLIPIMNLVCLLIPFLLYTASFVVFATVDVTASRNTPCVNCPEPTEEPLNLTVVITDQGFRVASGGAETLPPSCGASESAGSSLHIPLSSGAESCRDSRGYPTLGDRQERQALRLGPPTCAYDFDRLQQCMSDVKANHPDSTRIILSGEADTDYDVLIHAMDATRGTEDNPLFPDVSLAAGLA